MPHHRIQLTPSAYRGIETMVADSSRAFGRHMHLQFGLGFIERGAQRSASSRGVVQACAGDVITVNPGEVHDGAALDDAGRAWCMLYIDPLIVTQLATDVCHGADPAYEFHHPVLRQPQWAPRVRALFAAASDAQEAGDMRTQEHLLLVLAAQLQPRPQIARARITLAREMMDDDPGAPWSLQQLAQPAGLSRYQLVRQFARATGLTPHAYLMQRRIHLARQLIGGGATLGAAAAASGFADQSHMTRLFMRSFGVTPGAYARSRS